MKERVLCKLFQPARRDEAGWYLLCFGSDTEPVESGTSSGGVPPLLSILLSMNQVGVIILFLFTFVRMKPVV